MGNCAGKDSDKMVIANTDQPEKAEENNEDKPSVVESEQNEDVKVDEVDDFTEEQPKLEEADKLAVIGKKVQATNIESKPEEDEKDNNQAIVEEPKLTESEEEELEENSTGIVQTEEVNPKKDEDKMEEIKKEPKDEWVEILDPDQVRKEWIENKKENVAMQATPNAEPENVDKMKQNTEEIAPNTVHEN